MTLKRREVERKNLLPDVLDLLSQILFFPCGDGKCALNGVFCAFADKVERERGCLQVWSSVFHQERIERQLSEFAPFADLQFRLGLSCFVIDDVHRGRIWRMLIYAVDLSFQRHFFHASRDRMLHLMNERTRFQEPYLEITRKAFLTKLQKIFPLSFRQN